MCTTQRLLQWAEYLIIYIHEKLTHFKNGFIKIMNVTFLFSERHRTFHVLGQREGTRDFNLQTSHNCPHVHWNAFWNAIMQ